LRHVSRAVDPGTRVLWGFQAYLRRHAGQVQRQAQASDKNKKPTSTWTTPRASHVNHDRCTAVSNSPDPKNRHLSRPAPVPARGESVRPRRGPGLGAVGPRSWSGHRGAGAFRCVTSGGRRNPTDAGRSVLGRHSRALAVDRPASFCPFPNRRDTSPPYAKSRVGDGRERCRLDGPSADFRPRTPPVRRRRVGDDSTYATNAPPGGSGGSSTGHAGGRPTSFEQAVPRRHRTSPTETSQPPRPNGDPRRRTCGRHRPSFPSFRELSSARPRILPPSSGGSDPTAPADPSALREESVQNVAAGALSTALCYGATRGLGRVRPPARRGRQRSAGRAGRGSPGATNVALRIVIPSRPNTAVRSVHSWDGCDRVSAAHHLDVLADRNTLVTPLVGHVPPVRRRRSGPRTMLDLTAAPCCG